MSRDPAIRAVEFERRILCAVWGLAVTMALSGWSMAPWIEVDQTLHSLWELWSIEETGWPGTLLPFSMMLTLILGVAASAAGTRPVAGATWGLGSVTVLLGLMFLGSGENEVQYGAVGAIPVSVAFVVVFFVMWWTGKKTPPEETVAKWMDPSFGTIDKRYFGR